MSGDGYDSSFERFVNFALVSPILHGFYLQ